MWRNNGSSFHQHTPFHIIKSGTILTHPVFAWWLLRIYISRRAISHKKHQCPPAPRNIPHWGRYGNQPPRCKESLRVDGLFLILHRAPETLSGLIYGEKNKWMCKSIMFLRVIPLHVKQMKTRISCDFLTIPQLAQKLVWKIAQDILHQAQVVGGWSWHSLSFTILPFIDCVKKVELTENARQGVWKCGYLRA